MSDQNFFKQALSNFMYDAASGGAVRHLADLGYTVKEISKQLDFPTPCEKIRQVVWQHLLDKRIILREEPQNKMLPPKNVYVKDCDNYGRTSFRLVRQTDETFEKICWKENIYCREKDKSLRGFLTKKIEDNKETFSYCSCDFGIQNQKSSNEFLESLNILPLDFKDYILGLPWEKKRMYHRLDKRMTEILLLLYEKGRYQGTCLFLNTEEKILL